MHSSIYLVADYKEFLQNQIASHKTEKGYRSRMAEAAGCKLSYLSQVLNGAVHLMPEHACGLAGFWGLSSIETQYFVDLVNYDRAGTKSLRNMLHERLKATRDAQQKLSTHIKSSSISDEASQKEYYSVWYTIAIHVLISIEKYQTVDAIAARLGLPLATVTTSLKTLEKLGRAALAGSKWKVKGPPIHLPRESPYFASHFLQWRLRASLCPPQSDALHYTGIHSLSRADFAKIKDLLARTITSVHDLVKPSKEEDAVVFTCDLFTV